MSNLFLISAPKTEYGSLFLSLLVNYSILDKVVVATVVEVVAAAATVKVVVTVVVATVVVAKGLKIYKITCVIM